MKVDVYWNLHKNTYSVRHKGKVVSHVPYIQLANVQWIVQPAGRRRVLRDQRKNVHAFARGIWLANDDIIRHLNDHKALTPPRPLFYDPYRFESFVSRTDHIATTHSDFASLGSQYSVTHDNYHPRATAYNLLRTPRR